MKLASDTGLENGFLLLSCKCKRTVQSGSSHINHAQRNPTRAVLIIVLGTLGLLLGVRVQAQTGTVNASLVYPAAGALAGSNLFVVATVTSAMEIQRVKAQVDGREVSLVFSPNAWSDKYGPHPGWSNSISLIGLPRGTHTLTIEANDFLGNSATVQRPFVYDQKPILEVTSPLSQTVARPQIRVSARCTDDDPARCEIKVSVTSILATAHDQLDQTISLASFDGRGPINLHFEVMDSAGQSTAIDIPVYVESSPRLMQVEEVPGSIWHVLPDRILFLESQSDRNVLKIRHRASQVDSVVLDQAGKFPQYGALAPKGAIFVEQSGTVLTAMLYDERDGQLVQLGMPNSWTSLVVEGDYAIWNNGTTLMFRNLQTGQNTTISTASGNWMNDVAGNGDVVFWGSDYAVYRFRAGSVQRLSPNTGIRYTYVLTDGTWAVYRKGGSGLSMSDGTQEIEIVPQGGPELWPGRNFQINNGWVAFTRLGTGGQQQVWTRSPEGKETQITYYGDSSQIAALASNGEIMFQHGRRFLSRPGQSTVEEIDSGLGNAFYQEGQWYVVLGRSLFRVQPVNLPIMLLPGNLSGGIYKFKVSADEGQTVTIQTSSNLETWNDIATGTVTGGTIEFSDPNPEGLNHRFYRGKSQ